MITLERFRVIDSMRKFGKAQRCIWCVRIRQKLATSDSNGGPSKPTSVVMPNKERGTVSYWRISIDACSHALLLHTLQTRADLPCSRTRAAGYATLRSKDPNRGILSTPTNTKHTEHGRSIQQRRDRKVCNQVQWITEWRSRHPVYPYTLG